MAKDVLGTSIKSQTKEWFDEECKAIIPARNEAYHLHLLHPTRSKKEELDSFNRQVPQHFPEIKEESFDGDGS